MSKIRCCRVLQKAEIFKVVPRFDGVQDEFVLYLDSCVMCGNPLVEIVSLDLYGEMLKPVRLRKDKIDKFLDSMDVIWKPKRLSNNNSGHFSWALEYNEWGRRRKCSSNLWSLRIGQLETDPYIDLKRYQQYRTQGGSTVQ